MVDFSNPNNWQEIYADYIEAVITNGYFPPIQPLLINIPYASPFFRIFIERPTIPARAVYWYRGGWLKLVSGDLSGDILLDTVVEVKPIEIEEWRILHFPLINSTEFYFRFDVPFWFPHIRLTLQQYQESEDILEENPEPEP